MGAAIPERHSHSGIGVTRAAAVIMELMAVDHGRRVPLNQFYDIDDDT